MERLLAYNCHEIENSDQVLQVKKLLLQFSVVDIFDLLEEDLGETKDLKAAFPRGGGENQGGCQRKPPTGGYPACPERMPLVGPDVGKPRSQGPLYYPVLSVQWLQA